MRSVAFALVLLVPGFALASFDLLLIPDPNTGRVHRYDPVNEVSLGSFSMGSSSGVFAAHARAGSTNAYVRAGSSTSVVNWSTGERFSSTNFFFETLRPNQEATELIEMGSNALFRYNYSSQIGLGTVVAPEGVTFFNICITRNNNVVALGKNAANDFIALNYSPTLTLLSTVTLIAGGAATISTVSHGAETQFGGTRSMMFVTRSTTGTLTLFRASMNVLSQLTGSFGTAGVAGFAAGHTPTFVEGHGGNAFLLGLNSAATGTQIQEFDGNGNLRGTQTLSGVMPRNGGYWAASNIVAPEPGTMAALGLGLAAVLRRRRR